MRRPNTMLASVTTLIACGGVLALAGCRSACCVAAAPVHTSSAQPAPTIPPTFVTPAMPGKAEPPQVFIDVSVLALRDGALPHLVADGATPDGPWQRLCRPGECEELWAELRSSRVTVTMAPKILALLGQEATVSVVEETKGRPDDWTGLRLTTTPRLVGDGDLLRLDLDVRRRAAPGAPEQRVTVEGTQLRSEDTLLLVAPIPSAPGEPRFAVLVTPKLLRPTVAKSLAIPDQPAAAQVLFESVVLDVPRTEAARILGQAPSGAACTERLGAWRVISESAARELERSPERVPAIQRLVLPSVVSASGEEFILEVWDSGPSADVPSTPAGWTTRVTGAATTAADGRSLALNLSASLRTPATGGSEQHAEVSGATLRPGNALVLASPATDQDRRMFILLRATTLPDLR